MLFDTPVYFLFLALAVAIYWRLGWRKQNAFLVVASYFFYGWWDWRFLGLIWISTLVDYYCARWVSRSNDPSRRKLWLTISVVLNLGFLGTFKYFNFFSESLAAALQTAGFDVTPAVLNVVLPPGISFYTFQALAYITDVYFKKLEPAENLIDYALFISFFPHLIAGPIQRPGHLLPQTQQPRQFSAESAFDGLQLIAYGLLRKCVIADNCALLANAAFGGQMGDPSIPVLLLGTYAFAWQIYGDFAGYSDIARGSAQLMGFHFMVNFKQPYLATSLQDFWRRWHISLSTWLRDYLYIPLGGNRGGELLTYRNLFLTMLIGGFWHGANWTFVIWGMIHGIGLAIERFFGVADGAGQASFIGKWARRIVIFHVVCVAWVFFRAESLGAAWRMLSGITVWNWRPEYGVAATFLLLFGFLQFAIDLLMEQSHSSKAPGEYPFARWPVTWRIAAAAGAVVATTMLAGSNPNAFIYFQF